MTDAPLIAKKLAFIETCVRELAELSRPEVLQTDIREQRFVEHTLQIAIQAVLDVASHIVSDDRLGEPETNKALFNLLARGGWISLEMVAPLRDMAGFRNLLVHGYGQVQLEIVADILHNHTGDLLAFVASIRARIDAGA